MSFRLTSCSMLSLIQPAATSSAAAPPASPRFRDWRGHLMTGPDGDTHHGLWRVTAVGSPTSLEFTDAFADEEGTPIADMPVSTVSVQLTERDGGTRMEMRSTFESREDLEKWLGTGTLEGQQQAIGQMDALLA
jgi:uncharacterized protein YndB with AHSA1/START domain